MPDVAIIRATTADERGNLTYEHEGAYLGAARPGAGRPQQWRHRHRPGEAASPRAARSKPHDVRVPGILVDDIVVAPDQMQTTQTLYDPAISGEIFRPLSSFRVARVRHRRR